jgi:lipoprotein-anchoring transpeptidase ErfK/SrfK
MQAAERHVQDGKFRSALAELSPLASNRNLTAEQRTQLFAWLDALAGKVIYSREHHLGEAHRVVGKAENLYAIAAEHKVDVQLLLNVNSTVISDPVVLVPGTEIKIIPGPFRAEISLAAGELTLYLGQLYAGRFTFGAGEDRPKPGTYRVQDKRRDQVYYGRDGRQLAANDPANPFGGCWIDLGSNTALHGSPQAPSPGPALGCLSFSPQDANDLFAILSTQSEVVIQP